MFYLTGEGESIVNRDNKGMVTSLENILLYHCRNGATLGNLVSVGKEENLPFDEVVTAIRGLLDDQYIYEAK